MVGEIYLLPVDSQDRGHPHVIVLKLKNEYIGVPAFSAGGYRLRHDHAFLRKYYQTLNDDCLFAKLDNHKHVEFERGFE